MLNLICLNLCFCFLSPGWKANNDQRLIWGIFEDFKIIYFFFRKSIFSLEMVSFVLSLSRAALFQEIASQKEKIHL